MSTMNKSNKNNYSPKYDENKNYKGEEFPIERILAIKEFEDILKIIQNNLNEGKLIHAQEIINESRNPNGIKKLFKKLVGENLADTKGIYIYSEKLDNKEFRPVYVGISKSIIERNRGHLVRTDQGTATLALKIAREVKLISKDEKDSKKKSDAIKKVQNDYLKNLWVTVHPYKDESNFLLPMLEIYLAVKLKAYWNTFETH